MNRATRREFLQAEVGELEAMLAELPESYDIERIGFSSRLDDARQELKTFGEGGERGANVLLSFDGAPVAEGHGIDAMFAARAIERYQGLVASVHAARFNTASVLVGTKRRKPSPSALMLTETVHGSFGFELEEPGQLTIAAPSLLNESVKTASELVQASTVSDDAFLEQIGETTPGVHAALAEFVKVVREAHASCKMKADDFEFYLSPDQMKAADARVSVVTVAEADADAPGVFLGVLAGSRRFELLRDDGFRVGGKVATDVESAELDRWTAAFFDRRCIARLHVTTTTSGPKTKTVFVLNALDDP